MSEIERPIQSTPNLLKALVVSALIALAVFVTIVLPAEFGVDITGGWLQAWTKCIES